MHLQLEGQICHMPQITKHPFLSRNVNCACTHGFTAASSESLGRVASASTTSFSGGWSAWKIQLKITKTTHHFAMTRTVLVTPWQQCRWSRAGWVGEVWGPYRWLWNVVPTWERFINWVPIIKQRKVSRDVVVILDGAFRARGNMRGLLIQLTIASFVTRKRKKNSLGPYNRIVWGW